MIELSEFIKQPNAIDVLLDIVYSGMSQEQLYNRALKNKRDRLYIINRITDSKWAYRWARYIGNRDVMIDRITESEYAYRWARDIGDREVMIDRVTESQWTFYWARNIGDQNIMKSRVIETEWINEWNEAFPNDTIVA
jgi:phenolic acid decarboxylase